MDSYRSLEAWKRAHAAVILVHKATEDLNRPKYWAILDQLRRAVISIETNIVEGYALDTPRQFLRHLWIAFGSAAESECLVRAIAELGYLDPGVTGELESLLAGTMKTLRGLLRNPPRNPTRSPQSHAPRTTYHAPPTTHSRSTHGSSTHGRSTYGNG